MTDFWVGVLGNLVAATIVLPVAFLWHHLHTPRHLTTALERRFDEVHARLDALLGQPDTEPPQPPNP